MALQDTCVALSLSIHRGCVGVWLGEDVFPAPLAKNNLPLKCEERARAHLLKTVTLNLVPRSQKWPFMIATEVHTPPLVFVPIVLYVYLRCCP